MSNIINSSPGDGAVLGKRLAHGLLCHALVKIFDVHVHALELVHALHLHLLMLALKLTLTLALLLSAGTVQLRRALAVRELLLNKVDKIEGLCFRCKRTLIIRRQHTDLTKNLVWTCDFRET